MTASYLFIGLDAMEATLIDRWTAEGHLPAFAQLTEARPRRVTEEEVDPLDGSPLLQPARASRA
jgi:hypothetical protein